MPAPEPEWMRVELVDEAGTSAGTAPVDEAHRTLMLHRAFSVMLIDADGRMLLQRRAATKGRFAGLWSNTCCGHPPAGRDVVEASSTRVRQELGVGAVQLREVGRFVYRAHDPRSGLVEHEYDHVLVGRAAGEPAPAPEEVDEITWASPAQARGLVEAGLATPWLPRVLDVLDSLGRRGG